MKKFRLFMLLLIGAQMAKANNNFKGVFYEADYAVYGSVGSGQEPFVPYKAIIFEERIIPGFGNSANSLGYWVYDTVTITCRNFALKMLTNKRFIMLRTTQSTDNGGYPVGMMQPPTESENPPPSDQDITTKKVENFQFNTMYTYDQVRYSGKIEDHISTFYGKKDVLPLSRNFYQDYKTWMGSSTTFRSFISNNAAHPFEKMVLLQNQMNLFLQPDDYSAVFHKTPYGDTLPPLWEPPVYCDTNMLKEIAKYMPVFGGQCSGPWSEIYRCLQVNPAFDSAFNAYLQSIYPQWINYWENCVRAKYAFEAEECKCQRAIAIDGGNMEYWHKADTNSSSLGIMPNNIIVQNGIAKSGGKRPNWMYQYMIGYNPYTIDEYYGNAKVHRTGNNQGIGGWNMVRSSVPYGGCSGYFDRTYTYGDTLATNPVNYYETRISYGCVDINTELAANCACPITVLGTMKQQHYLAANSLAQSDCRVIGNGSYHAGKMNHAAVGYYYKYDNLTGDGSEIKLLDAGQAMVGSWSNSSINMDYYYKLADLALSTAAVVRAGMTGSPSMDTSLINLIKQGLGLASTRLRYDTIVGSMSHVMMIDKPFSFVLYPNEEATVRLDNYSNYQVKGEDAGWTELVDGEKFLVGLYGGAKRTNNCCNPAFIAQANIGMQMHKNNLYTNLSAKGMNPEPWDYHPSSDVTLWGGYYDGICGDTILVIYKNATAAKIDQPEIKYTNNGMKFSNFVLGNYQVNIYSMTGQKLYTQDILIDKPTGDISLELSKSTGIYIIELVGQNYRTSQKIWYER